jgi:fumarylacetoacetate (FAA) hydrolase
VKLATIDNGTADGRLVVVTQDGSRYAETAAAATLQQALENWAGVAAALRKQAGELDASGSQALDPASLRAPLPRAWQWLDGSAFKSHGDLMDKVLGIAPITSGKPLMYQGASDRFYGPAEDVLFPSEDLGIDFEGEFGVIVDEVPMGIEPDAAMKHIRLLVQINDWSLRILAGPEMKTGFGWVQAKPPCSMAPFAVTPDELGDAWKNGRVCLPLKVDWNGVQFGAANGAAMGYGFHELVAHAARTRRLVAGTVIGSGTVSNANFREIGSSCIAERRGIEIVDTGSAKTEYMRFGDRVRMEARMADDSVLFGAIDQRVAKA